MSILTERWLTLRRGTWLVVCAVVATAAVCVTVVRWRHSVQTQSDQRAALSPKGVLPQTGAVIPNPFGTDAEALAAVPAEYVAGLGNIKDDTSRLVQARAFAADGRFSGATAELGPFLEFIEGYQIVSAPPTNQEGREKTRTASFMLYTLVAAWHDVGPFDSESQRRIEAAAVKLSRDSDPANQIVALCSLRVLGAPGSPITLSAAGKSAMDTLTSDAHVSFQADRTATSILARPKRDTKAKGG